MALTTPLPYVPETRMYTGPGVESATYLIVPGVSDYPTNGYVINALDVRLTRIHGAEIVACNAAAAVYAPKIVLAAAFFAAPYAPQTSMKFMVLQTAGAQPSFKVKTGTIGSNMTIGLDADAATASLVGGTGITADRSLTTNNPVGAIAAAGLVELSNGTNLTGCAWAVRVWGY